MKRSLIVLVSIFIVSSNSLSQAAELKSESLEEYNTRMQWFADTQYGMFIHFGLYSILGGEWKDQRLPNKNGGGGSVYSEWIMGTLNIDREEYAELAKEFNPADFDAETIVSAAKKAGMTYLVITSKHHEGFCLWDSAYTDYDIAATPIKDRDLLMELKQACDKHGIRFGLYYSILDWHHHTQARPVDLGKKGNARNTQIVDDRKQEYVDYQRNQVLELIEKYEPSVLWFDGDWVKWWTMKDGIELYNAIRNADRNVIVNNRVAKRKTFELDYVTQEQKHFKDAFAMHWEGCYTMNYSWGYKKSDDAWKSAQTVYDKLKDINEKGGALLLNVGPDGNGVVQPEAYAILAETAELLKANPIKKSVPNIQKMPGIK
ncbi:MAG: alpha-L-fucosidase [Verrucomicrobiota bacterium]